MAKRQQKAIATIEDLEYLTLKGARVRLFGMEKIGDKYFASVKNLSTNQVVVIAYDAFMASVEKRINDKK